MKKILLAGFAFVTIASSCQSNFEKTPSGLVYKIYHGKSADSTAKDSLLKPGDIVKMNLKFVLTDRPGKQDSLLSIETSVPQFLQIDTSERAKYSFMEVLPKLKPGDSAVVIMSVDTLRARNIVDPNDSVVFVKGSNIKAMLKVINAFSDQEKALEDYNKEAQVENEREIKQVEEYMAKNNLKGEKTKSGAFVIIENPGDQSIKADSGTVASIMYRGKVISNGVVFDTNMDSSKGHTDPISVNVGANGVIRGWEEGLPYFGKGATGKILVPAFLGYGAMGAPPDIMPYANLIFDIEVLDVKPAPATPPTKITPRQ